MNRREVLASAAALAGGGLAGCLSGPAGDDGTDTEPETTSPTSTSTLRDPNFTVNDVGSADPADEASVTFGDETVVVDGTIVGNNGCYYARLDDATYEDGTLTVTVEAYEQEDAEACTQALVAIDYTATFRFGGRTAQEVVVEHLRNGERTTVHDTRA